MAFLIEKLILNILFFYAECCELLEERLGLRKFTGDVYGDKYDPSSKSGKSNKGAVGFLKGLFSKKEKQPPADTKNSQSKIELPALNANHRGDNGNNTNGALDTGHSSLRQRPKKHYSNHMTGSSNHVTGAIDNTVDPEQDRVTKGVNRLSIDAHVFDDDSQTMQKPRKHRKKKKERHKHLREDGSSPTTFKTESSAVSVDTFNLPEYILHFHIEKLFSSPLCPKIQRSFSMVIGE